MTSAFFLNESNRKAVLGILLDWPLLASKIPMLVLGSPLSPPLAWASNCTLQSLLLHCATALDTLSFPLMDLAQLVARLVTEWACML